MQRTNNIVRAWLTASGYKNLYFFPHGRFSKDYHIDDQDFDGICTYKNKIVFFQCKTNCKPTRKKLKEYDEMSDRFGIICLWFNYINRKGLEVNNEKTKE